MKKRHVVLTGCVCLFPILAGCGYATTTATSAYNTSQGGGASAGSGAISPTPANVPWMQVDKEKHMVSLDITAAQSDNNHGLNFNGYSNGMMTITVPLNWHVNVAFANKSTFMPHSVVFVPFSEHSSANDFHPAFSGAASPAPSTGILAGQTQRFSFMADKEGQYAMVCAVPGHSSEGLWDTFVVSSKTDMPSVSISSTGAATDTNSNGDTSSGNGY